MYSFGKIPPRTLESFGVAGLLAEEGKVIYENLFSTQHLGRVTDLLVSQLKTSQPDELRLRSMVLYLVIEALQTHLTDFNEPIVLECGSDSEKVIVGAAFSLAATAEIDFNGLPERVAANQPINSFEAILSHLFIHSHRVLVKVQPERRRIEIDAVLGFVGIVDESELNSRVLLELIALPEDSAVPNIASYTQLADLDYSGLLEDGKIPAVTNEKVLGEILAKASEKDWFKVAKGSNELDSSFQRVKGSCEIDDSTLVKVGGRESNENESQLVKGGVQEEAYLKTIAGLQAQLQALEEVNTTEGSGGFKKFIEKFWPFGAQAQKNALNKANDQEVMAGDSKENTPKKVNEASLNNEEIEGNLLSASSPDGEEKEVSSEAEVSEVSELGQTAKVVLQELQNGSLAATLDRAQTEWETVKSDVTNPKVKKWMDNMLTDLLAEKIRLAEFGKKVSDAMKTKDMEFRQMAVKLENKERIFQTELRNRDRLFAGKEQALERMRESLEQANVNLEKLRADAKSATSAASKNRGPSANELTALQTKYDRTQKQLDDLKKSNQALTDKMNDIRKEKDSSLASVGDLKKRLESSSKMLMLNKKQSDRLSEQLEAMKKDEARLKGDLNRAQTELNVLKGKKPKVAA